MTAGRPPDGRAWAVASADVEKVIYALWRDPATPVDDWSDDLRHATADAALAAGALGLQVNVADAAVARAATRVVAGDPVAVAVSFNKTVKADAAMQASRGVAFVMRPGGGVGVVGDDEGLHRRVSAVAPGFTATDLAKCRLCAHGLRLS